MDVALSYIWIIPVAIGVVGAYYFAMKDLKSNDKTDKELRE